MKTMLRTVAVMIAVVAIGQSVMAVYAAEKENAVYSNLSLEERAALMLQRKAEVEASGSTLNQKQSRVLAKALEDLAKQLRSNSDIKSDTEPGI